MISVGDKASLVLVPAISFFVTLSAVPLVGYLARRWGCVALPSKDRWHTRPTTTLGGVAIFLAFIVSLCAISPSLFLKTSLFIVATQMFLVGVYDDLHHLRPTIKLIAQVISAVTALCFGYSLGFFRWMPLDAVLTALWIVGLTNALNLLDNMDGLAGGIGLIAACYLAFLFNQQGDPLHALPALALAGALVGFLLHNFHPASIFMGDAGSLFLGSALSLLTVQANGQASNILSLIAVPVCILLVPILDTTLVTLTRLLRGEPISRGGKDHASHRLIVLGLNERQAVLLLYCMATVSGATALMIKWLSYTLSLVVLPLVIISFALFTAYLAQVEVISKEERPKRTREKKLTALVSVLTYKRRLLEITLDFVLMAFAYYLAFALRFEFHLSDSLMHLFLTSLPLVVLATYAAFLVFGIYRGLWRYTDLEDLARIARAVAFGTLTAVLTLLLFYRFVGYSRVVFILYALLLFFGMAASRLSFRLFGLLVARRQAEQVPVLVYGAGDGGEVVVRECRQNPRIKYRPIGFLDDDPKKQGRTVLGLPILGGADKLAEISQQHHVQGCIISSADIMANGHAREIRDLCRHLGLWMKQLRLDFIQEGIGETGEQVYLSRWQSSILDSWD